ncbi:MAG TPA: outer membrane beta-barrel protein [Gemmatimonadaceae bacterium]|nr:outer membrane beta-barrel protein [Gemmatimonadaceae bacterium]
MRLLSRVTLAVGALLFAAPSLHAQLSFSLAAGASLPMGDAAEDPNGLKMGYNATVGLGFKPLLVPVGLRVEGMFNSFEVDGADVSQRVLGLTGNATYTILPQLYAIGGIGMYNSKASVAGSESSTDFGFNIGAGVNIPLTGFGTYVEARYHHIPVEGGSFQFVPITFGIKF